MFSKLMNCISYCSSASLNLKVGPMQLSSHLQNDCVDTEFLVPLFASWGKSYMQVTQKLCLHTNPVAQSTDFYFSSAHELHYVDLYHVPFIGKRWESHIDFLLFLFLNGSFEASSLVTPTAWSPPSLHLQLHLKSLLSRLLSFTSSSLFPSANSSTVSTGTPLANSTRGGRC